MVDKIGDCSLGCQNVLNKNKETDQMTAEHRTTSSFVFWNKTRMYIMVLTLFCFTLMQMNSLAFNFSVICIDDVINDIKNQNSTEYEKHWIEDPLEKSLMFSAVAIGGVIGIIPSVPLIDRFGFRVILTTYGLISAIGVLFFPISVTLSFYASLFCRLLQGIGSSVMFTGVGVIPGEWAPMSEVGTFMAVLSCALQFSNIICMPFSGFLCESSFGWQSIYYIFGVATILSFIIFHLTYTDSPTMHRNVSEKELRKIGDGKTMTTKTTSHSVPYLAICTDRCVIASWISCIGGHIGFFLLVLYGPTFLKEVLEFDIRDTGFLSAVPFFFSAVMKFVAGQVSDRLTFLSEKARFVFFGTGSQVGMVAGLLLMSLTSSRSIAQIAYTFAIVSSGLNVMGVIRAVQLRTLQHVHFSIAVISLTAYFSQFIVPIAVSILCPDNTRAQWSNLLLVISATTIVANIPFPFLSSTKPGEYTKSNNEQDPNIL